MTANAQRTPIRSECWVSQRAVSTAETIRTKDPGLRRIFIAPPPDTRHAEVTTHWN